MENKYIARLPENFRRNITDLHAEKGERWLMQIPDLVADISKVWRLVVDQPFQNLSYHFVAPCLCDDGSEAVLKIGFAEEDSIVAKEAEFLRVVDGDGAVRLFRFDEIRCALLLERLRPGENLVELARNDDEQATAQAIRVLKKIRRLPPKENQFPTLEKWVDSFLGAKKTNFEYARVKKAQKIFERLIGSSERQLLHGDLHHQNILSAQRDGFLAIDPKGIVGEVGFEISVFLNNPRGWLLDAPERGKLLHRRVEQFAEAFALEPGDLRDWAFAEAVLSAWWTIEDGGSDWKNWLACAEIWEANLD